MAVFKPFSGVIVFSIGFMCCVYLLL